MSTQNVHDRHRSLPALARRVRNFARRSAFEQLWLPPIWLMLGLSRALILTVPFRRIAPSLGVLQPQGTWVPLLASAQQQRARQVGRTVQLAARYTPWDSNCFAQAVVAGLLLRLYRVPYTVHFGLARGGDKPQRMTAHAWVVADRVSVTGGYSFSHYTVVACFARPAASPDMP